MQNSKLVKMLKTFGSEELKELEKFIESPYFSRDRDCLSLFKALKNYHPDFNSDEITNQSIFQKMYPGKKYGDVKSKSLLSTMNSELYKLCKGFLIQAELNEEKFQKGHLLLNQLRKRNLNKEFIKEYEKTSAQDDNSGGSLGFLNSFRLHSIYGEYLQGRGDTKGQFESLLRCGENALAFGLVTAYRFIYIKETAKNAYDLSIGFNFIENVLGSLNSERILDKMKAHNDVLYPYISANYMVYMMNKDHGNWEYYYKLKEILENNIGKFGYSEKYMLYCSLESYIVAKENLHYTQEYTRELFNLYDKTLKLGVYKSSPDACLELDMYRNMLLTAHDLKEFDWAEKFINNYSGELPAEQAQSMKDYSLAHLYFTRGEFEKAMERVMKIKYDYFLHKIDAKILLFKIYYELNSFDQAFSIMDAAKHYLIKTKELAGIFKTRNLNFLKYASELLKRKGSKKTKDIDFVLQNLKSEMTLESKGWLVNKMEQLAGESMAENHNQ